MMLMEAPNIVMVVMMLMEAPNIVVVLVMLMLMLIITTIAS